MSVADDTHRDVPAEAATAAVSEEEVRAAVERVVASPDFDAPDRVKDFLRYIVDETLAGRAERIKAFSVAIDVFGRDQTFDPHADPLVRIEAGRLRRALEHYYLTSGAADPVRIDVPKGGYVPTFEPREPAPGENGTAGGGEPAAPARQKQTLRRGAVGILAAALVVAVAGWLITTLWPFAPAPSEPRSPSVLVLPFDNSGDAGIASVMSAALTDELIFELARFKEIRVFGSQTSRSIGRDVDVSQINERVGADYLVEGQVTEVGDAVRVGARLIDGRDGKVLWSAQDRYELNSTSLDAAQTDFASGISAAIAQPYGIVFRQEMASQASAPPDDLDAYLCTLSYYTYRADPSLDRHTAIRECLTRAVTEFPRYATARALLALIYVDEIRAGFNRRPDAAAIAIETAREAVRLEPENTRALQALSGALFFGGQLSESLEVGRRALELNPNDTELLGQIGQQIGLSGEVIEGRALIEEALARNPGHSDFYRGALAVLDYLAEDYGAALTTIDQVNLRGLPIYHAVAAIIYARNGEMDRAAEMMDQFQQMAPGFVPNLWTELKIRNIPVEAQMRIAEDLGKAGAEIPPPDGG